MVFRLHTFRFEFVARDPIFFPAGKPGNILRGALGTIFRRIACDKDCDDPVLCGEKQRCPYARIFEPSAAGEGPSGLSDWPRPFVFRAGHLDGTTIAAGDPFHFNLNLFEVNLPVLPHFIRAFSELVHSGLGPNRGRAEMTAVRQLDRSGRLTATVYDRGNTAIAPEPPLEFGLKPASQRVQKIRVEFLAPTELKADNKLVERPSFGVLFRRARDRVSALSLLYQGGSPDLEYKALGLRANTVATNRCEVEWRDVTRKSSRTGQVHPIGGFVGVAEYTGDLAEFLPILTVAQWTGVGRHTVWGKGHIRVTAIG